MPAHKYADVIIAWANGKNIERLVQDNGKDIWVPCLYPTWNVKETYRVAKTSVTKYRILYAHLDGIVRVTDRYLSILEAELLYGPNYLTFLESTAKVFEE